MQETRDTAVVILNWNGRGFLGDFLPGVVARSGGAMVMVADNGSTDGSMELLQGFGDSVVVLELGGNYGYAGGYNRALRMLREQYPEVRNYVLLNSDVEVTEGWLVPLVRTLEVEGVVAAQPKILSYHSRTTFEHAGASGGFIDTLGYPFCRGRILNFCEQDKGQYDSEREVFWATGAALAIRAEAFEKSGGFDEIFFAHMEEIDLCWRLKRAGGRIMVAPGSVVYHVGGGALPMGSPRKIHLNFRNNLLMLYKNLTALRFALVYSVRLMPDTIVVGAYLLLGKVEFVGAIVRAHRDFWRLRGKTQKCKNLSKNKVGGIYRGSIILRYILGQRRFKKIL